MSQENDVAYYFYKFCVRCGHKDNPGLEPPCFGCLDIQHGNTPKNFVSVEEDE